MSEVVLVDNATGEILSEVRSVDEREASIRSDYSDLSGAARQTFELICHIGGNLAALKADAGHGKWADYLAEAYEAERLPFKERQAQKYLRIFEKRERLNPHLSADLTVNELDALCSDRQQTRAKVLTGEIEWYTPQVYIDAARRVMGGIDLDPASSEFAQEKVQADRYYTMDDDGLALPWEGRIWLNPPYKAALIKAFVDKLLESPIDQAILLTNNATDTGWWHEAAGAATAICFHRGRIQFYRDGDDSKSPTHGQTIFYFGTERDRFIEEFVTFGLIR